MPAFARRRAALGAVTALAVATALAACGTTVPKSQRAASIVTGGELGTPTGYVGAGAGAAPATSAASTAGTAAASDAPATADGGGEGAVVAPVAAAVTSTVGGGAPTAPTTAAHAGAATSTHTSSAAAASTAATTAAVPAGPIEIGMGYLDAGATNAVTGGIGKGLAQDDLHAETDAYVASINAHGGVLGRPLKMVYFKGDTNSSEQQYGQGICATETQDNHVLASVDPNYGGQVFPCLTKAGVITVDSEVDDLTDADYASDPYLLTPDSISLDRLATLEATQLPAMGYKPTGSQKLGILYYDTADVAAGYQALKAAWAAQGVQVADAVSFHQWNTVGDIATLEAAVQGTELKFKTEGITHVMCVEQSAFLCAFFGLYAQSQNYHPRFAFNSSQGVGNISVNLNAAELTGSVFLGWSPAADLNNLADMPAGVQSCVTFMVQHGFSADTDNERDGQASICESIDYIVALITAGGAPTAQAMLAGAKKLGTSYPSRRTFVVGPRQDGAVQVRPGAYSASCSCFAYTGPPVASS